MGKRTIAKTDVNTRRIAVRIRDLAAREMFTSKADLVEAVKGKCARFRLPWTRDAIDHAIAIVASNTPVIIAATRASRRAVLLPPSPIPSRAVAASILDALYAQLGK